MMTIPEALIGSFSRAGLPLTITRAPLARAGSAEIVQMDISRGRQRCDEHFRIWPGSADNRLEVRGLDRRLEQLVLRVKEARRRFEAMVSRQEAETQGLKPLRSKGSWVWVERFTDEQERHFLCGRDEQHGFIAQLPEAAGTVAEAHQALRPQGLTQLEGVAHQRARRQGEFFFIPLPAEELARLLALAPGRSPARQAGIAQAAHWQRRGRPHVADEVLALPSRDAAGDVVLVRGYVRHPDHRPVHLPEWTRVLGNREPAEVLGLSWID
jgi:hypothetical protein